MRAVVTGGTGFLGGHLLHLLRERGVEVRLILRPGNQPNALRSGIDMYQADIRDAGALRKAFAGASVVFHLAGLTAPWAPRHRYLEVNLDGTRAVVEACVAAGVGRLVHVSSMVVLGLQRDRRSLAEDASPTKTFVSPYEESKLKAEQVVQARIQEDGLPAVILRPGMGWGPGERVILPELIRALASPFFFMVGNGRNTLDLSYGSNVAQALWLAATHAEAIGRIYHVADGFQITCRQYLTALATALHLHVPRLRLPRGLVQFLFHVLLPPEPEVEASDLPPSRARLLRLCALFRDSEPDTTRIRTELGYRPPVDFASGIGETAAWYRRAYPAARAG